MAHAVVIGEDDLTTDAVGIGSHVLVETLNGGAQGSYQIVGSQEADPMNGRISEESPFGRALLGKKCGEEVLVSAPAGTLHYRVLEIQK